MPASVPKRSVETAELDIKSVLLLDDNLELAETLKELLELQNFVVTAVANGAEGLREVMALDFDVIICDMMMPYMRGDMFYLAVQKTKPHLCKRFIFITGHGNDRRVTEFLESIHALALFKPVRSDDLIQMISLVLKRAS